MNYDKEDFDRDKKLRDATPREARQNLTMIQQAGLSAEMLTGDPHWDKYLSYLQAALNSNRAARDSYMNDLANPTLVNNEEVAKRRIAVMRLNERIEVLNFAITLPGHLIRLGAAADVKLKALPEIEIGQNDGTADRL
jgi:hypothetical protein